MKKILTLISICTLFTMFSCTVPSGETTTIYFPANEYYSRLYVSDGMKVTVTDEVDEIVITGDENVLEKLTVDFTSDKLRIYRKDVSLVYLTPTEILLPYNEYLRDIELNMDSEFYTPFGIESDEVKITLGGRSKFEGYVYTNNKLFLKMDDSKADLEGYSPILELDMKNGSLIEEHWTGDYFSFECDNCYGSMSESTAYLHCYEEIRVNMFYGSMLYFTSDDEDIVNFSGVDDSSDVIYCGGNKK